MATDGYASDESNASWTLRADSWCQECVVPPYATYEAYRVDMFTRYAADSLARSMSREDFGLCIEETVDDLLQSAAGRKKSGENAHTYPRDHIATSVRDSATRYQADGLESVAPWSSDEPHIAAAIVAATSAAAAAAAAANKGKAPMETESSQEERHAAEHAAEQAAIRKTAEIADYVKGCLVCQADKNLQTHPAGKLMPLPVPKEAWDHITMDRIVGLPKTKRGNTAILVVVDRLTKMTHIGACKNTSTAQDLAWLFVDMIWKLHGFPLTITTDRGPEFTNKFNAHVLAMVGTKHARTTAYHPQSDGQTERVNRVLEDMLRHYVNPKQDNWDDLLAPAEFAINNAYHSSIQDTPFFCNYSRHPRMPSDFNAEKLSKNPIADNFIITIQKAIAKAKLCMEQARQRQKWYADRDRDGTLHFEVGDLAWLSSKNIAMKAVGTRKLLPRWLGPS